MFVIQISATKPMRQPKPSALVSSVWGVAAS